MKWSVSMPPYSDGLDGPVAAAARRALERGNVGDILPWVPEDAETELKEAFELASRVRRLDEAAMALADHWFIETAVRLYQRGGGVPYMGSIPAGLREGPILSRAERSIERGDPRDVIELLKQSVEEEVQRRFDLVLEKREYAKDEVNAAREYIHAMLGFLLYAHHLYTCITSGRSDR
jgi:hypothetical protein